MSVTFHIVGSPQVEKSEICGCNNGCVMCNGTGMWKYTEDEWPSLNVANTTAITMFGVLGLDQDYYSGSLKGNDLKLLLEKLDLIIESPIVQKYCSSPTVTEVSESGCTIITCGRTPEQMRDRFQRLRNVVMKAIEEGKELNWG